MTLGVPIWALNMSPPTTWAQLQRTLPSSLPGVPHHMPAVTMTTALGWSRGKEVHLGGAEVLWAQCAVEPPAGMCGTVAMATHAKHIWETSRLLILASLLA